MGETVSTLAKLMPDDYIQIAEHDGEPVAFISALPNLNEATRDLGAGCCPGLAEAAVAPEGASPGSARIPSWGCGRATSIRAWGRPGVHGDRRGAQAICTPAA